MGQISIFSNALRQAEKHLAKRDPRLRPFINHHGECRLRPRTHHLETLVGSIISQQLSTKAADTIQKRFLALYPESKFPPPEAIFSTSDESLRGVGLSSQKLSYIKDLAAKVHDGTINLKKISRLSDEEIIASLTQVKGIGVWTVQMFLIFSLGRLNVLPVGDLGIRNAIQRIYGFETLPQKNEIENLAERNQWHPYCSVASWYLWRSLENKVM